jgi:hypothetical protein
MGENTFTSTRNMLLQYSPINNKHYDTSYTTATKSVETTLVIEDETIGTLLKRVEHNFSKLLFSGRSNLENQIQYVSCLYSAVSYRFKYISMDLY